MGERWWSYTTPNPHRTPISIEVGGDADVLAEMGGERIRWCEKHRAVPRDKAHCPLWWSTSGCRIVNAWVVKEAADG